MPAFEYAIQAGVDVLELDLAVTKDDVLVASHDPVLSETLCQGEGSTRIIREMTLTDLRRWDCGAKRNPLFPKQEPVPGTRVPTLEEVLGLASRGGFHFNIETKIFRDKPQYTPTPERFAQLLVEIIKKHKLESRVIIQSFDFRTLVAAKKLAPEIRRAALFEPGSKAVVARTQEAGATILSPHFLLVSAQLVADAHKVGLQVIPWTANTADVWDRLIRAEVDAIITDDPAALIAHLKSKAALQR